MCEQFQHLPFRRALILSKLLDSGEGQKQNLQLQRAAVAWREMLLKMGHFQAHWSWSSVLMNILRA